MEASEGSVILDIRDPVGNIGLLQLGFPYRSKVDIREMELIGNGPFGGIFMEASGMNRNRLVDLPVSSTTCMIGSLERLDR